MSKEFEGDAGAPLPDFTGAANISLETVSPALGIGSSQQPDYLDYDQKGRGIIVTMFANTGVSYLIGIGAGGIYGLQRGLVSTPSSKWRVQVNSVLNHCGRYGSKAGNTLGVFSVLYSLYEGLGDQVCILISTVYKNIFTHTFCCSCFPFVLFCFDSVVLIHLCLILKDSHLITILFCFIFLPIFLFSFPLGGNFFLCRYYYILKQMLSLSRYLYRTLFPFPLKN